MAYRAIISKGLYTRRLKVHTQFSSRVQINILQGSLDLVPTVSHVPYEEVGVERMAEKVVVRLRVQRETLVFANVAEISWIVLHYA